MKIGLFVSFMAICLLGPAYALGQTNAEILLDAENELSELGCMAYQSSATAPGTGAACRANCFRDELGNSGWDYVYKGPGNRSANAIWWIGDSRTVGMYKRNVLQLAGNNEAVLARVGMGYSWFNGTALPKLRTCLCDGDTVILTMGANDVSSPDRAIRNYTGAYQNLIQTYRNVKFYVLSVNPVLENLAQQRGYSIRNADIETFNEGMSNAFSSSYINTYDNVSRILEDNNGCSDDGVHYNNRCRIEQDVYDTVMNKVNGS